MKRIPLDGLLDSPFPTITRVGRSEKHPDEDPRRHAKKIRITSSRPLSRPKKRNPFVSALEKNIPESGRRFVSRKYILCFVNDEESIPVLIDSRSERDK